MLNYVSLVQCVRSDESGAYLCVRGHTQENKNRDGEKESERANIILCLSKKIRSKSFQFHQKEEKKITKTTQFYISKLNR